MKIHNSKKNLKTFNRSRRYSSDTSSSSSDSSSSSSSSSSSDSSDSSDCSSSSNDSEYRRKSDKYLEEFIEKYNRNNSAYGTIYSYKPQVVCSEHPFVFQRNKNLKNIKHNCGDEEIIICLTGIYVLSFRAIFECPSQVAWYVNGCVINSTITTGANQAVETNILELKQGDKLTLRNHLSKNNIKTYISNAGTAKPSNNVLVTLYKIAEIDDCKNEEELIHLISKVKIGYKHNRSRSCSRSNSRSHSRSHSRSNSRSNKCKSRYNSSRSNSRSVSRSHSRSHSRSRSRKCKSRYNSRSRSRSQSGSRSRSRSRSQSRKRQNRK